jgi:glutamate---cysteine ligase / carboxylate-amine ligase
VGVEEELLLVDEQTLEPVAASASVVERAGDGVKQELMATFVETATSICDSPQEAYDEVRALRARVAEAVAPDALRALAIGSHPFASPDDAPIVDNPDYLEFVAATGPVARRQGVCGLHVHVGMPDPETCVRAHEGVLPWLPLVLALSVNSPWFRGEATGLLSTRAEVLATLPRSGVPPSFGSWEGWVATMERWIRAGVLRKPTGTWWDLRIHPALGTLEIRAPDQPTDVERTGAFIGLLHALAAWAAQGDGRPASRADAHTNRFFASRFGPKASLIHPDEDRLVPVPELYAELVERLGPFLEGGLLAPLDPAHSEAERQLAAGDPRAACADAVERSLASRA